MLHAAFDNFQITEEEMVVENDTVATRWTASGVQRGEFMRTGPSREPFRFSGTGFYRIVEGKIVKAWSLHNSMEVIRQLGPAPTDGKDASTTEN
jgi:predicted ester cyclase